MKDTIKIICILIGTLGFIISSCVCSKKQASPIKEYVYILVKDTIAEKNNIDKIIALENELEMTKDSFHTIYDSINNELIAAKYKLNRIEEYCKVAKKGNNIKYLRGWILRTLKD